MCVLEDTWSALTATDEVETGCVNDAGLASTSEVAVKRHLEEHEGRVNAVMVESEQVPEIGESPFGWEGGWEGGERERERERGGGRGREGVIVWACVCKKHSLWFLLLTML